MGLLTAQGTKGSGSESPVTPPRIVDSRRYRPRPMSAEDAVMELDASGEELLVFREAQSERIQVLYRQRDGNFALIDPES